MHSRLPSLSPAPVGVPVFVGARFHPGSAVTVTLSNGEHHLRRIVLASRSGRFVVRFGFFAADPCRGNLSAIAIDGHGAKARWKHECRPPSETAPVFRVT